MNSNSPTRSRELRHLELRGFLGPWTRDLKTGVVSRHNANGPMAQVLPGRFDVADKVALDIELCRLGFRLLTVPGGCQIEREP